MYEIEKGVPIPDGRAAYPFEAMEVGDSFVAANKWVGRSAWSWGRARGKKFSVRKQPDGTVRIWRVA